MDASVWISYGISKSGLRRTRAETKARLNHQMLYFVLPTETVSFLVKDVNGEAIVTSEKSAGHPHFPYIPQRGQAGDRGYFIRVRSHTVRRHKKAK